MTDLEIINTIYSDLEKGWKNAFAIPLCIELLDAVHELPDPEDFEILQIKEKFGELRIYCAPSSDEIREILNKYRLLSRRVCGSCGAPATKISQNWIFPYCDKCAPEETYDINKFWEDWDKE